MDSRYTVKAKPFGSHLKDDYRIQRRIAVQMSRNQMLPECSPERQKKPTAGYEDAIASILASISYISA